MTLSQRFPLPVVSSVLILLFVIGYKLYGTKALIFCRLSSAVWPPTSAFCALGDLLPPMAKQGPSSPSYVLTH